MKFLSVCSGIESASVAWLPLGWECIGHAEIGVFPNNVLKHHYPDVKNYGDLMKWREWNVSEKPDVIVGGTPCQDFSVAGARKEGERANLTSEYIRLVGALRPEWFVWENVPGVLSMGRGRTFARILREFSELGYGVAGRVLDAKFFGVPQRRRRVFLVGHISGDPRRAGEILFESKGLPGNHEKGRGKGERTPQGSERCSGGGSQTYPTPQCDVDGAKWGSNQWCIEPAAANQLDRGTWEESDKAVTVMARDSKSPRTVVFENHASDARVKKVDECPTITQKWGTGGNNTPIVLSQNDAEKSGEPPQAGAAGFTAKAGARSGSVHYEEEVSPTIKAGQTTEVIAFTGNDYARDATKNIAPTLRSGGNGGLPSSCVAYAVSAQSSNCMKSSNPHSGHSEIDTAKTVDTTNQNPGKNQGGMAIVQPKDGPTVRRITPVEALRLQGFPGDHLDGIPGYSDTQAYRAIGNSKAVPVVRWIGERIDKCQ